MPGTFEEVARKAYSDRALTPGTRELILAIAYGALLDPEGGKSKAVSRAARHLGRDKRGNSRISRLVIEDLPRYEPPQSARFLGPSMNPPCSGPRVRPYQPRGDRHSPPREDFRNRDKICGGPSRYRVVERDPRTGWIVAVYWYCGRHKDESERVSAQVAAINEHAPEPVPNRGGRLPTYFTGDWEKVYRHYAPRWKPPVYGIRADEWPAPETMAVGDGVRKPRLRVIR